MRERLLLYVYCRVCKLSLSLQIRSAYVLLGGYQTFCVKYPFMCSTSIKKAAGGMYPSAIDDFLFLGSHENAKSRQQLKYVFSH